jgi:hypothetical protein
MSQTVYVVMVEYPDIEIDIICVELESAKAIELANEVAAWNVPPWPICSVYAMIIGERSDRKAPIYTISRDSMSVYRME